ncbi:7970_t:CDS:1, partial [Acaulospora colombiana]
MKDEEKLKFKRSLIFVNRHWCENLIHELWRDPFRCVSKRSQRVALIETYLRCLPEHTKREMGLDWSESNEIRSNSSRWKTSTLGNQVMSNKTTSTSVLFDYPFFLCHLDPDIIYTSFFCWAEDTNAITSRNLSTRKDSVIFLAILKNFIIRSENINHLSITGGPHNIFEFPGANLSLSNLRTLNIAYNVNSNFLQILESGSLVSLVSKRSTLPKELHSASLISKEIRKIRLSLSEEELELEVVKGVRNLIEVQKSLKSITIRVSCLLFFQIWE